jgi:undecaprenyl diphosphate synthase
MLAPSGEFIGLISDGNRREVMHRDGVATVKELTREQLLMAYRLGAESVKRVIERARQLSVGIIAPWGMSDKNMESRSELERGVLYEVFREFLLDLRDNWVDLRENERVRLLHLGREDRLLREAPGVVALLREIAAHTRERAGMVVAVCLDYGGIDEARRAEAAWLAAGCAGSARDHLDLPRQGVPFKPLDLRIRTGETTRMKHLNAFLHPYVDDETREVFHEELLPCYTADQFEADVRDYRRTERRKGA